MTKIEGNLKKLGITIPAASSPVANYVGFTKSGNQVFISGQLPVENGEIKFLGKVGNNISVDEAKKAARLCGINILSQVKLACDGDLDRVVSCLKIGVFVNSEQNFTDHPVVANGASDLLVEVFGNAGKHARAAVGVSSLPRGASVEVDAIFLVR